MPLYVVDEAIRSISEMSAAASVDSPLRLDWLSVPSAACSANSFSRMSMEPICARPLSAVCKRVMARDMLSFAVRCPASWARIPSAATRPAGSSAARLMRSPDVRRSICRFSSRPVWNRFLCALIMADFSLVYRNGSPTGRRGRRLTMQEPRGLGPWRVRPAPRDLFRVRGRPARWLAHICRRDASHTSRAT